MYAAFTALGAQPTHDDVTYESIAEAFGRTLVEDRLTVAKMTAHYTKQGKEVNAARMRMAVVPSGTAPASVNSSTNQRPFLRIAPTHTPPLPTLPCRE
jgi:molybdopterin-biosynthesis enzyme MoeA-like protein